MRRGIKNTWASSVAAAKSGPLKGSSSTQQHRKQENVVGAYKRGGAVRKSKTMPDGVEGLPPSAISSRASAGAASSTASAPHSDVVADRALIKTMVKPGSLKRAFGGRALRGGGDGGLGRLERSRLAAKRMK